MAQQQQPWFEAPGLLTAEQEGLVEALAAEAAAAVAADVRLPLSLLRCATARLHACLPMRSLHSLMRQQSPPACTCTCA